MKKNMRILTLCVFGILVSAPSAWPCQVAGNLVTNCGFNADITGWTSSIADPACIHNNADGSSAVGNSQCGGQAVGVFVVQLTSTCIDVAPNTTYGFGADFRLVSSGGTVNCFARAEAHTNNTCETGVFPTDTPGINPTAASYTQASGSMTTGVAQESVVMRIQCSSDADFVVHLDDAFFGIDLTPVELQEFSVE